MNETQMDGTQADDSGGGNGGMDRERFRRLRMKEFLRDLVRQEGKMEAAELLGVNHKTLTRAEESGEITGRMSDAIELLLRRADDAEVSRLRETVGALEARVAKLECGPVMPDAAEADGQGAGESGRAETGGGDKADTRAQHEKDAEVQPEGEKPGEGAGRSETGAAPRMVRLRAVNPDTLRPLDPEIVTVEPADDDHEVYGEAWPLVEEWRRLREGHPVQGRTLSWLENEERLLVLELAMLEEHGLTLPPEKQPLRGFGRDGQTTHRWKALAGTRVRLRKRRILRRVRTVLTLWLWRK